MKSTLEQHSVISRHSILTVWVSRYELLPEKGRWRRACIAAETGSMTGWKIDKVQRQGVMDMRFLHLCTALGTMPAQPAGERMAGSVWNRCLANCGGWKMKLASYVLCDSGNPG